ncbi:hypothetical protein PGTUg99_050176 [Puccinia graminis f. sp. tritici]|uniref:Uncharacterized protein n=1 Tax=Puccinia graminis f. sp. tritici TaxID=56615 RepID=A0A5B0RBG1_PUCGR|nr:hypothetical protein PGTUg99_050176 [Puccinia graminis f. sp. tritici]
MNPRKPTTTRLRLDFNTLQLQLHISSIAVSSRRNRHCYSWNFLAPPACFFGRGDPALPRSPCEMLSQKGKESRGSKYVVGNLKATINYKRAASSLCASRQLDSLNSM